MKKKIASYIKKSEQLYPDFKKVVACHAIWHKFDKWMGNTFSKDLFEWKEMDMPTHNGKIKKYKYKDFDEAKFNERLVGYEVQCKIEKWVKRCCPEIVYSSSFLILVPHPKHGISIIFIPQCTSRQNRFFLYEDHCLSLIKELTKMKKVYKGSDF